MSSQQTVQLPPAAGPNAFTMTGLRQVASGDFCTRSPTHGSSRTNEDAAAVRERTAP